ncbi:MAG: CPBP family intramembrane glutamic endopeptidase [Candidatus Krumholzibacteriia bacterium]
MLAVVTPAATALFLVGLRSVFATFAVYQVGLALVAPAVDSLIVRRLGWRDHLEILGVAGRGAGGIRALLLGLGLGVLAAVVVAGFLHFTAGLSDPTERIRNSLAWWGITAAEWRWLSLFMMTVHVPAEELLWRGYLQTRLVGTSRRPRVRGRGAVLRRLALISGLFASYHAFTLANLVPLPAMAATMFAGVWLGGMVWAWLRWWTGSLWPALLSHYGAVAAYVLFVPDL